MKKLIKNTILVLVIVSLGLFLVGCEKNHIEPEPQPEVLETLIITSVSRDLEYFNEYAIVVVNEGTPDEVVIDSNTKPSYERSKLDLVCHCTFYTRQWMVESKTIKTVRIYNRVNGRFNPKFNITVGVRVGGSFVNNTTIKWDTKENLDEGYVDTYYWSK